MYTTCINCGTKCRASELDFNSECLMCQFRFANKMKQAMKDIEKKHKSKSESYYSTIPLEIRQDFMKDAMNLYKIKFKNKNLLIDYLNDKYNLELTRNIFNNITHPSHLQKLGLSWKFELQKLKRIK